MSRFAALAKGGPSTQQQRDKKRPREGNDNGGDARPHPPPPSGHSLGALSTKASSSADGDAISEAQLAITMATLSQLSANPDLFRSPRFRPLRSLMFPLVQAPVTGLVARVSDALSDGRWADAVLSLRRMQEKGEVPKLGSVQRWVRDCDVASVQSDEAFRVLDLVMRVASPELIGTEAVPPADATAPPMIAAPLIVRRPWVGKRRDAAASPMVPADLAAVIASEKSPKMHFFEVGHEKGATRNPPNVHDLVIYSNRPEFNPLVNSPHHTAGTTKRVEVPCVHGAFFLADIFTVEEAHNILRAAESVGYLPDVPLTDRAKSTLAHNFVWLPHAAFMTELLRRVQPFLPQELGGGRLTGINSRFRCYRYVPGAVYRAHVDGAWPRAGLDDRQRYVHDASNGRELSRLTFLIYLNDGFEGGCTTFLTPSVQEGLMDANAVVPRCGCALVFPHGDTAGSLVHEGSGVTSGVKYIIRTEVLYEKAATAP